MKNKKLKKMDSCYADLFSCKGRVCVVTGASGLLGQQLVKGLSDFGAKVYAVDLKLPDKKSNSEGINFIALDIACQKLVDKALTTIEKKEGRIDVLVNCAYPRTKDWANHLEKVSIDSWNKNINDHVGGYFISCRSVAKLMKKNKAGSIINFGSIYGVIAPDFSIYQGTKMTMPAAYSAIKGGIISFTKYLAAYYGKDNLRANVISPGGVFNGQDSVFVKKYVKKTPLKRMADPQDIVGAVIFLASDASSYITGQNLIVDGGWSVW